MTGVELTTSEDMCGRQGLSIESLALGIIFLAIHHANPNCSAKATPLYSEFTNGIQHDIATLNGINLEIKRKISSLHEVQVQRLYSMS